nr:uncharacterized protein LOC111419894 [Onthophagus taurus]
MPTGSAASKSKKRNPILEQLSFLDSVKRQRRGLTNNSVQTSNNDMQSGGTEETVMVLNTTENDKDDDNDNDEVDIENLCDERPTPALNETISSGCSEPKQKKRKPTFAGEVLSALKKNRLERAAIISQMNMAQATPDDETDTFFKSLALTVKQFPPLLRAQIKRKLYQIVSDAEVDLLRSLPPQLSCDSPYEYSSTSTTPLPSPSNWEQQNVHNVDQCQDTQPNADIANLFNSFSHS